MESHQDGQSELASTSPDLAVVRRHRRIAGIGLGAFMLLIAFAIYRGHVDQRKKGFLTGGPMPVEVAQVSARDVPVVIEALGTVTPLATVNVRPQVSGPLLRIAFKEGDMVRAGALLAQIDPRPYQAALDQSRGQLARDEAALASAKIDLQRYRRLLAQDSVSEQTYTDQRATVNQDKAQVEADQAALETARLNLSYCSIVSPITGRAGLRQVDPGNLVQANQSTPIVTVTQMQPMSVIFTVPENDLAEVFRQMHAGEALTVEAYSRDMLHRIATGRLASIDNQINTTTGTLQMRALFANTSLALFPNEFVNVKLILRTLKHQIVVPGQAVQNGPSSNFVYVVQPNDTVALRTVVTGPSDGEYVSILKGLKLGETVVTDGADQLRNGAKIRIPGAHPGGAPGKAGAALRRGEGQPVGTHA
jgi:multidrug efflux system membrane fusion protein